jgi:O-methyltransferase
MSCTGEWTGFWCAPDRQHNERQRRHQSNESEQMTDTGTAPTTTRPRLYQRYSDEARRERHKYILSGREEIREAAMYFAGVNGVQGDYLEFGTFRGDGLIQSYYAHRHLVKLAQASNPLFVSDRMRERAAFKEREANFLSMRFIAFDSFAGFDEPTEDYERELIEKGDVASSYEAFIANLEDNQVDLEKVTPVRGFFADTLNRDTKDRLNLKAAAIVYIDCDLYEPTVMALDFVTDLLVDGSILIFDDWFLFKGHPRRGEQGAFNEWLERNPSIETSEFYRRGAASFIVHK